MKDVLALILAGGRVDELSVLTLSRPKSAVPFGGMYRVIDFPLSNLMHSGIERVGVLSQYRSFSLINHIGVGSWWDFVGRDRGATLLMPSTGHRTTGWYKGTSDAVYQNLGFVIEQDPATVLILSGDHVYKMDYRPMLDFHREKNADLTIAFYAIDPRDSHRFGVAEIDDEDGEDGGRVLKYEEKPEDSQYHWASLTIFAFKLPVLVSVLNQQAGGTSSYEFGRDIIPQMVDEYRVFGYKFKGYWSYARTMDEFWQTNMDLLGKHPKVDLEKWQVRTNLDHDRIRDRPPAKIGESASIQNALVHNGCEINGEVSNSILFPGVKVARGAVVRDSVLFFDTNVAEGCTLEQTITDANVKVGHDCSIGQGNNLLPNTQYPDLLNSGITLIGKGVHLPAGLRVGKNCIISPEIQESEFPESRIESGAFLS
ncbi:MAG: glucose-1-phosphate adenylyltransferase family protein [bacterium]